MKKSILIIFLIGLLGQSANSAFREAQKVKYFTPNTQLRCVIEDFSRAHLMNWKEWSQSYSNRARSIGIRFKNDLENGSEFYISGLPEFLGIIEDGGMSLDVTFVLNGRDQSGADTLYFSSGGAGMLSALQRSGSYENAVVLSRWSSNKSEFMTFYMYCSMSPS